MVTNLIKKFKFSIIGLNIGLQGAANCFIGLSIAHGLSVGEQAEYYVLVAILNIPLIFDFGLGFCIAQFVSYLASGIEIGKNNKITAAAKISHELNQLLVYASKFSLVTGLFAGIVSLVLYFSIISSKTNTPSAAAFGTIVFFAVYSTILLLPCYGIIEGIRMVDTAQTIKLVNTSLRYGIAIYCLKIGFGSKSIVIGVFISNVVTLGVICFLWSASAGMIAPISSLSGHGIIKQIWSMQFRMGIGAIAGYVSNYLPNLIMHRVLTEDSMARCAMTVALIFGVGQVAQAPIIYKQSRFSYLRSVGLVEDLKTEWISAAAISVALSILGAVMLGIFFYESDKFTGIRFEQRVLEWPLFVILSASCSLNQVSLAIAALMRSNRREVFAEIAVITAALTVLGIYVLGKLFGQIGVTVTFFFVSTLALCFSYYQLNRSAIFKA
jgi:hypothetical protein